MDVSGHRPRASISLDLDNLWSYMKTHGDVGWEKFPSYLDVFIPRVLELLDLLNLKITFFIVGQDAALDENKDFLNLLTAKGHEAANHSFNHEPWLQLYTKDQIRKEILEAEEEIIRTTGQKPIGFRGPGFSWSPSLLEVLAENEYVYDASTFPTYLGPLARKYYFWTSKFGDADKNLRKDLFGGLIDGTRSVRPYYWQLASGATLLEIPVTTVPIVKIPFHLSYLVYLSRISQHLATLYLRMAIGVCRITRTEPSFLLHPLDLMGGDQCPELAFFPGMDLCGQRKVELFKTTLQLLAKHFRLVPMKIHARSILEGDTAKLSKITQKSQINNDPVGDGL